MKYPVINFHFSVTTELVACYHLSFVIKNVNHKSSNGITINLDIKENTSELLSISGKLTGKNGYKFGLDNQGIRVYISFRDVFRNLSNIYNRAFSQILVNGYNLLTIFTRVIFTKLLSLL